MRGNTMTDQHPQYVRNCKGEGRRPAHIPYRQFSRGQEYARCPVCEMNYPLRPSGKIATHKIAYACQREGAP